MAVSRIRFSIQEEVFPFEVMTACGESFPMRKQVGSPCGRKDGPG